MKKMNKAFSLFLAIIMVVSMLPISASAATVAFTSIASSNDIKAGDIVTVDVAISENSNVNAITLDVVYDNSVLEYASHTAYGICGDEYVNKGYADGKIRFASAKGTSVTDGGTILTIQFKALSSACSDVSLDVIEAVDKDLKAVDTSVQSVTLHSFGEWTTETEPLCEKKGQKSKSCSCGEKQYAEIDALGHDYSSDFTVDTEPSCTEKGSKSQHCSRCESTINATEIPATGHSYEMEITKIPTHTENGEKTYTCTICDGFYTEIIEADGEHKHISSVTTEPTCTEKGVMTYTCACGDVYTEGIPALGHTVVVLPAVEPTCTENGKTEGSMCSVCENTLVPQLTIGAKGHSCADRVKEEPTCTYRGIGEQYCTECGVVQGEYEIPALGHTDEELDGKCDVCETIVCSCGCHKTGLPKFFWSIGNFFKKLFGNKAPCACGKPH